jgi:hypothetical protein
MHPPARVSAFMKLPRLTRELLGRRKSTDHGGMEGLRVVNAAHPVSSKYRYAKTSP